MKLKKNLRLLSVLLLLTALFLTGCAPTQKNVLPEAPAETEAVTQESQTSPEDIEEEEIPDLSEEDDSKEEIPTDSPSVSEEGTYTSKEEVAAYLHEYGHLPSNYLTKKEAKALGWVSSEGNLDEVAPGMSIEGDYFGNYEGTLPEADGRDYHECDIDFDGTYRNAKRIVYSDDGLIYYTEDHYETFELLYGEE